MPVMSSSKVRWVQSSTSKTDTDGCCEGAYGVAEGLAKMTGHMSKHSSIAPNAHIGIKKKAQEAEKRIPASDGSSQPGFASSKVPTLEERVVSEHLPKDTEKGADPPLMDSIDEGKEPQGDDTVPEATTQDGTEMFGAPADAAMSAATDDRPPNDRPGQMEASEVERSAVEARKRIRQHLSVKTGSKPFTLPVPGPEIDPHGFEDPLDEKFFNDMWMASAVHNVSCLQVFFPRYLAYWSVSCRLRFTERCFTALRTT